MHSRHRSPGNGYRSGSMRISGVAAASRISPESSTRGHGMFNSEYRSYNRGFGRGQPKPFQVAHHQVRRESSIFMEAGRLATEYLVSKGLLPPNALSCKWQNGSLKNQIVDFQGFRQQEVDNLHPPQEGRTSALARLGNAAEAGSCGKRFGEEYNQPGSRSYMRGRGRIGSFKNYGTDWGREMGRNGPWSEKARPYPGMEVGDDSLSGYQGEQQAGNEAINGVQKPPMTEFASKSNYADNSESGSDKLQENVDTNTSSSDNGKDLAHETDVQLTKRSDDIKLDEGPAEFKNGTNVNQLEKQTDRIETLQPCADDGDSMNKNVGDLLSLCRFAKVPTRIRSSLTNRGTKVDQVSISKDDKGHDTGMQEISLDERPAVGSELPVNDVIIQDSVELIADQIQISKHPHSDLLEESPLMPAKDVEELIPLYAERGKSITSQPVADRSFTTEEESSEGPPGFGKSSFMLMERGEKRAARDEDSGQGMKKAREWVPSVVNQTGELLQLSNLGEKQPTLQEERRSSGIDVVLDIEQERPMDMAVFQRGDVGPYVEHTEEKQLFPGSFKICDLNLMETSEVNENPDPGPVPVLPPVSESKKEASTIDVDLSISNNCNISRQYGMWSSNGKEVEVIDLENDSMQEDKAFNNLESKAEPAFTGLETFSNPAPNTNDISDVQDGYGLMFSEFLGNDISNCSSVPPDINSLHHDMSLHNEEGILGDDESIYMSLGEIPISFLRVWEQPTQEYEKPF